MEINLKKVTSPPCLGCSPFCLNCNIFFHSDPFYKIFMLTMTKFFHGKQCTSQDRNFNKSKATLGHKVVSALCGGCYSKLHTQLNCFYQNLNILVCRLKT